MHLTCLRGYPASGKSTAARQIADSAGGYVICRDNLRHMLFGEWWTGKREHEDAVTAAEEASVKALLKAGQSVIVDATHLEKRYLTRWVKIAAEHGADFTVHDIKTPAELCAYRDERRSEQGGRSVGIDVINRMAKRHPINTWPSITPKPPLVIEPVEHVAGLPDAIIVDIDGTLTLGPHNRSPYDYTKISQDLVDPDVQWIVQLIADAHDAGVQPVHIIIMSGRDDTCRDDTVRWLADNNIFYNDLHMRPTEMIDGKGNKVADTVVKLALFDQHVRGKYNVRVVLDDRKTVVDQWRAMGLTCFQVQPGDF